MIEYLSGKVLSRLPHSIIVDVNGVGYGVEMPLSSLCETPPPGELIQLWIDTYVREDSLRLFGFPTFEDKQAFLMLRSVSGIGPKIALAILSTLDAKSLRQTVLSNKIGLLESVPGIGRRTAEKLILELKPKMERQSFASAQASGRVGHSGSKQRSNLTPGAVDGLGDECERFDAILVDVKSALENLGYKDKEIQPVISEIMRDPSVDAPVEFQGMLKNALKSLRANVAQGS
jgi:Holliday junction DNA helicase RuvA